MAYNPINPNGQATSANSSPVVIASDQSAVDVTGTVGVNNFPATQPVSGTFWQTTQPVTGIVDTQDPQTVAIQAGELFLAGSGELSLTVAGNARITVQNPSTSTKNVYIYRLDIFSSMAGFAELFVNPTTGLPSGVRPNNNLLIGNSTTANAIINADTNSTTALSGGTNTGVSIGAGANVLTSYPFNPLMIIPPSVTVGVNVPFTGSANISINILWQEK